MRSEKLLDAAAVLTPEDFRFLQTRGIIPGADQQMAPVEKAKRTRRSQLHVWPAIGRYLGTSYYGTMYRAQVVPCAQFKRGKGIELQSGPAAGAICRSMSGAMLKATEVQRGAEGLGQSGVSNGWIFWRVEDGRAVESEENDGIAQTEEGDG